MFTSLGSIVLLVLASIHAVEGTFQTNRPVPLGQAANFVILSKAGISTVPPSHIVGDIGVSPISANAITGFSLTTDSNRTFSFSGQVIGRCFGANYAVPTPSDLSVAVSDMERAFTDAAGRTNTNGVEFKSGLIGGETLVPGVYTWTTDINIVSDVFFNGQGDSESVFILQTSKNVIIASNVNVILVGDAQACNIFWQVSEGFTVGAASHLEGIFLVKTAVTFQTQSSLHGRIFSQTAITLQMTTVTQPVVTSSNNTFHNVNDTSCLTQTDTSEYGSLQCEKWAYQLFCLHVRFQGYMQLNCRGTCCRHGR